MTYQIDIDLVKIPGQRRKYMWTVYKAGILVESGDSYYVFNAKRAARRAADRDAGRVGESELHYTEDYDPTA